MSEQELLKFEITLSGTYWDRVPEFDILIDDQVIFSGVLTAPSSGRGLPSSDTQEVLNPAQAQVVTVDARLLPGDHVLGIRLKNKSADQTRGFNDGVWTRDMLLTVESIKIDDIDLQNLIFTESEYVFDQPQMHQGKLCNSTRQCVCMGYNGVYYLPITSPFYMWLMEKL
jgi:hypothetical protein